MMNRRLASALAMIAAAAAHAEVSEPRTAEEAAARAVAALGGAASWAAIESMELSGSYATFSSPAPFRLWRRRPNDYRFDHRQAGMEVTVAFDGNTVWWHNRTPFSEVDWPSLPPVAYRRGYQADAEFEPPFIEAEAKAHRLELSGVTRFEGVEVYGLEVTLGNGLTETWYLDRTSFIPIARISRAGFKIFETESLTFFSDYRQVAGALMPFHVETEVDNLVSIMTIDEIRVNVDIDDEMFTLPKPPVLRRLARLAGKWKVRVASRILPTLPWLEDETTATIESRFDGRLLEEEISYLSTGHSRTVKRLYAHDRFRERTAIVQLDDLSAHVNVLEHDPRTEPLTFTNLESGTEWHLRGSTIHDRLLLYDIEEDGFKLDLERSVDGGETWISHTRLHYSRIVESP